MVFKILAFENTEKKIKGSSMIHHTHPRWNTRPCKGGQPTWKGRGMPTVALYNAL